MLNFCQRAHNGHPGRYDIPNCLGSLHRQYLSWKEDDKALGRAPSSGEDG